MINQLMRCPRCTGQPNLTLAIHDRVIGPDEMPNSSIARVPGLTSATASRGMFQCPRCAGIREAFIPTEWIPRGFTSTFRMPSTVLA